jgi:hypothetical protein
VGSFSLGWSKLQTVSLLMSSHFPKKWSVAPSSLSLPPTWVGSVDDCKVELVSFSSVGSHGSCVPVQKFISEKKSTFLKTIKLVPRYMNVLQKDRLPEILLVSCLVANLPD